MRPAALGVGNGQQAAPADEDLTRSVAAFLGHLSAARDCSEHTLTAYARDLRQFLNWLAAVLGAAPRLADVARLDAKGWRGFMAARRKAGLSSRSVARTIPALPA